MGNFLPAVDKRQLPANFERARLPELYVQAVTALKECSRLDEVKGWSDKAEALRSYARQAHDPSLEQFSLRIRARATLQMGKILKEQDGRTNHRQSVKTQKNVQHRESRVAPTFSQRDMAKSAGLSKDQQVIAVRVANIPSETFEKEVESDNPPTVTTLARMGTNKRSKKPKPELNGRDPKEYKQSMEAELYIRQLAHISDGLDPDAIARGANPPDQRVILESMQIIQIWFSQIRKAIRKSQRNK